MFVFKGFTTEPRNGCHVTPCLTHCHCREEIAEAADEAYCEEYLESFKD